MCCTLIKMYLRNHVSLGLQGHILPVPSKPYFLSQVPTSLTVTTCSDSHFFPPPFNLVFLPLQELRHQSKLPQDESREDLMQWACAGFPGAADDAIPLGRGAWGHLELKIIIK